jgi:5'-nucleotidase
LKPLGDKQLAIVGITLDLMEKIGCPDHDCHFLNAIETTRNTIEYLKSQGIVHIIVLSHLGYSGDLELAKSVDSISLIVGGHSHTLTGDFSELDIPCTQSAQVIINDTLIIQAGKHAESIGIPTLITNG